MYKVKVTKDFDGHEEGDVLTMTEQEYFKNKVNVMLMSFIPCNTEVKGIFTK